MGRDTMEARRFASGRDQRRPHGAGEAASRAALEADAEASRAYGDPITALSPADRQAAVTRPRGAW